MADDIRIATTVTPLTPLVKKAHAEADPGKPSSKRREPKRSQQMTVEAHTGLLNIVEDDMEIPRQVEEHRLDITI
jgi:hypothetical protein